MWITSHEYRSKVEGCWMGKNIGGTLGAPFEGQRGVVDIDFYTQDLGGEPLPNDDLDLQLVWLNAVEKYGRAVTASILGEYWHSYITPSWSEYGLGKNNMRKGLVPPLSGWVNNPYRDSCGCFIRSEIWACLAPGHPELAARYAYEDAIVDHSTDGVYGEIFVAAVQSAAFVESDKFKLIDIGLSWIPADCGVARGVRCALESYRKGLEWKAARKAVLTEVPDHFALRYMAEPEEDVPWGPVGYDAPANVAIFVLGWLYGEDDFGRSLCIAVGCGEDTDCTGATLGATLGIIHGIEGIPAKWIEPIGNKITTISLNLGDAFGLFPRTIQDLTDRVMRLTPRFMDLRDVDVLNAKDGYRLQMREPDDLVSRPYLLSSGFDFFRRGNLGPVKMKTFEEDVLARQPFQVRYETPIYTAWIDYGGDPLVHAGQPVKLHLQFQNIIPNPQWLEMEWFLPEGWQVSPAKKTNLTLPQFNFGLNGNAEVDFTISSGELPLTEMRYDLLLSIKSTGRHTHLVIPVTLLTASEGVSN
ncbi:MAG: ADP-ribosylglycohydrolase family protein [Anaerolineales bacterium]|nr:ADP-ribosylglycohydrolase family protein [Anaerolineales bacterium]